MSSLSSLPLGSYPESRLHTWSAQRSIKTMPSAPSQHYVERHAGGAARPRLGGHRRVCGPPCRQQLFRPGSTHGRCGSILAGRLQVLQVRWRWTGDRRLLHSPLHGVLRAPGPAGAAASTNPCLCCCLLCDGRVVT
jgi:hypothetical protein